MHPLHRLSRTGFDNRVDLVDEHDGAFKISISVDRLEAFLEIAAIMCRQGRAHIQRVYRDLEALQGHRIDDPAGEAFCDRGFSTPDHPRKADCSSSAAQYLDCPIDFCRPPINGSILPSSAFLLRFTQYASSFSPFLLTFSPTTSSSAPSTVWLSPKPYLHLIP